MSSILKIMRNPYLSIFMALTILFVSCEQYTTQIQKVENKFDYTIFNENKDNPVFKEILNKVQNSETVSKSTSSIEKNQNILDIVNNSVGTNLNLPDLALDFTNNSGEEILNIAYENKWITQKDVILIKSLMNDYKFGGFDYAIKNYEKSVLEMNLSAEGFAKKNYFLNVIQLVKYQNVFNNNLHSKSENFPWDCVFAVVGVAAGIAGLIACATVVFCAIALAGYLAAIRNFIKHCITPYM